MLINFFGSSYFPPLFILSGAQLNAPLVWGYVVLSLSRYFLTLSLKLEDFSNFPLTCLSGSLTTSLMFFFQFLGLAVDLKSL